MLKHIPIDNLKDLIIDKVANVHEGLRIIVVSNEKFVTKTIGTLSSIYNISPYLYLFNSSKKYVAVNFFRKQTKGVSLIMQFGVGVAKLPPDIYVNDAQEEWDYEEWKYNSKYESQSKF